MTDSPAETEHGDDAYRAAILGELPADLTGSRLLELTRPGAEGWAAAALAGRGAEEIVHWDRPQELPAPGGESLDFVLCRDVLRSSPYPMALLTGLWHLISAGGVLLLDAEIVEGAERSQYARFVAAENPAGGWVPGRLALRWMVETSGFDVERWLEETQASTPAGACLRATRAEREPARSAPG